MLGAFAASPSARTAARVVNPEALPPGLYILGKRALDRRGLSQFRASIDNFQHATELDMLYAEAYSGLLAWP